MNIATKHQHDEWLMDWTWADDEDELVTAYHEAGHAIVGCALGAQIDRVSLSQASMFDDQDDGMPHRFGDCIVNWGRVDPSDSWQRQRELLTILAGPVAEFVYQSGDEDLLDVRTWASDWRQAQLCAAAIKPQAAQQVQLLREAVHRLRKIVAADPCWSAIAALADELMLGDEIEGEQVADLVRFWWSRA
ncbi:cell division protein FtsH [Rhodopirellula sp. P2]|uniref:cell division protein FtsH n=1 Tax=Rhodopirellula sp. P2 TaxID=2127060 RepID=UPI0023687198|nr:cell division protein FtsH [Rhodopirellula sp. P2]WDQ14664.1 cell division protein FtsH [Rhodopirellula sp. P2]